MNADIAKATEITRRHAPFVQGAALFDNIAKAVAEGIALGRKEAMEIAQRQSSALHAEAAPDRR